jgi:hypothetical protein
VLLEAIADEQGWIGAAAALLGVAGFLPLASAHQELCAVTPQAADHISWSFEHLRGGNQLTPIDPTEWTLNRARPANHPARRLASLATLVVEAAPDGLLARVLALELSSPLSCDAWLKQAVPALGGDRRAAIATNVVAPFLAAYADVSGDEELSQCVATFWEQLPGQVSDATARRALRQIAGAARLPIRLALEEQGLHQIGRFGCAPLRCFECPIADLAARYEQWS